MRRSHKRQGAWRRHVLAHSPEALFGGLLLGALTLAGCANNANSLDPKGPVGSSFSTLAWTLFVIAAIVVVIVGALFLYTIARFRASRLDGPPGEYNGNRLVLIGGVVIPALILFAMIGYSVSTLNAMGAPAASSQLRVQVTAVQWWWQVRYPDGDIITANEMHIPVGRPVQVELRSTDVIHSFWVPQLRGKTDVIPGRTTTTWLQADSAGTYRGECAEYCGLQHAMMNFVVVAEPQAAFDAWRARQRQPAQTPTDPRAIAGMQAILRPECIGCHRIAGTPANGAVGPDLTHLGGRQLIAGGALTNTQANVAAFILNPQQVKPGTKMPDLRVDKETAEAIAYYLETLK